MASTVHQHSQEHAHSHSQALVASAPGPSHPHGPPPHNPGASALTVYTDLHHLIYSIAVHYHNQKTWVFQTRAALELALARGDVVPKLGLPAVGDSASSSMGSDSESSADGHGHPADANPYALSLSIPSHHPSSSCNAPGTLATRRLRKQTRRNPGLHLKLDGLSNIVQRQEIAPRGNGVVGRRPAYRGPTPSAELLQLYSDLTDRRMESCHRVTRLIQASNRANLQNRFQG